MTHQAASTGASTLILPPPISSGKMEGINNKIGRLTRLAYGYRDKGFMFLKILSLHESNLKLSAV